MRRVALVGALAALVAVAVVGALARPWSTSVEARGFPPAASELRQLWAAAPKAPQRLPPTVRTGGGTIDDNRVLLDWRLFSGRRLLLIAERQPSGTVCVADNIGGAGVLRPASRTVRQRRLVEHPRRQPAHRVLRDGTTGADVEIFRRWRPTHLSGWGIYLDFGRHNLGSAITAVRYHLADGTTVTCDRWGAC